MPSWQHTSIRLSSALRALLHDVAQAGDRSAALRALAVLGAAQVGLPLNDLRQELGSLLAVSLDARVHAALTRLYVGEPLHKPPATHVDSTSVAPTTHVGSTKGAPGEHSSATLAVSEAPARGGDPFGVGLEV